jgi:hypothetical protein
MAPGKIVSAKEEDSGDLFRFQFRKTRLCSFYMEGRCSKGAQCGFAHDMEQVETPPDLTKTSLCPKWQKGQCKHTAATCKFAHGKHELRTTPQFVLGREGKKQAEKAKKKTTGKDITQANGPIDEDQIGTVSAFDGWLDSQMMEPFGVEQGLGLWEDNFDMSLGGLFEPPPGISSIWMSEPMKVIPTESFAEEMELPFKEASSLFAEKLSEKYHEWENDRTTVGSNSDDRSSRSHSPSSLNLSPRKIYTHSTMMDSQFVLPDFSPGWEAPWNFMNTTF